MKSLAMVAAVCAASCLKGTRSPQIFFRISLRSSVDAYDESGWTRHGDDDGWKMNTVKTEPVPPFEIFTALTYVPTSTPRFSLLPRHFARLRDAHRALADELPSCWCAHTRFPAEEELVSELERCVEGKVGSLRVRLSSDCER
jgi:hypothetical protein